MTYGSPDNEHWYVAARTAGRPEALLLGPFPSHSDAATHVEPVRLECQRLFVHDPLAHWAEYGVARLLTPNPRPGRLNGHFTHLVDA